MKKSLHIDHLELLAALQALKCFTGEPRDKEVLIRTNNSCVQLNLCCAKNMEVVRKSEIVALRILRPIERKYRIG